MSKYRSILGSSISSNLTEPPTSINTCGLESTLFRTDPITAKKVEALIRWHNGLVDAFAAETEYWGTVNSNVIKNSVDAARSEVEYYFDAVGITFATTASGYIYLVDAK